MTDNRGPLPVSVYCDWQWWERHFQQAHGRPEVMDYDWLDETYLLRQRFLYESFGQYGLGAADPTLDPSFLGLVLPYHELIVPILLGVQVTLKEVGGYGWHNLTELQLRALQPVDIADTPLADHLRSEREDRLARYGVAPQMIDLGSVSNNAFVLRGPTFYEDLMLDIGLAEHYMEAITETMCLAYRFISDLFGPIDGFPIANCNVTMMSPDLYVRMIRKHDTRCVDYAASLTGKPHACDLHHCDVPVETFAYAYSGVPGLRSLQASYLSDIEAVCRALPGVSFSAMVSPVDLLAKPAWQVDEDIDRCVACGASDLAIWNIDPEFAPSQMSELFGRIKVIANRHQRNAVFAIIPFSWEELDWEFPRYRLEWDNCTYRRNP